MNNSVLEQFQTGNSSLASWYNIYFIFFFLVEIKTFLVYCVGYKNKYFSIAN